MKKIDLLLLKSFIGPFFATFCVGLFVLIMQILWLYIDDIIGKGIGFWVFLELLSYLSLSLVPTALPIAILLSSVMVMGNMAEHYELASLKSAGVPLLRIMAPLIIFSIGIMSLSFICSNYVIPIANLKFKSRLYDIKRTKPMLSLEEGIFNDDFRNMVIHIGKKAEDSKTIYDVLIYDHNAYNNKKTSVITAEKGQMFTTEDGHFFVMNLFDGTQYQETKASRDPKKKSYPFVRTSFSEWTKVFDLQEFDIKKTNTELFKNNYTMLSAAQLSVAIDSIDIELDKRRLKIANRLYRNYHPLKDSVKIVLDEQAAAADIPIDISRREAENQRRKMASKKTNNKVTAKAPTPAAKKTPRYQGKIAPQRIDTALTAYKHFIELFEKGEQTALLRKSSSSLHSLANESQSSLFTIESKKESRVKHVFELHNKYSLAVVCVIFLFIGAPMGAIIRKGGFGYPLIVAVLFFVSFMIMNIFFKKVAESHSLPSVLAAWMTCIIYFPMSLILTYRAMNDLKMSGFGNIIDKLKKIFTKKTASAV